MAEEAAPETITEAVGAGTVPEGVPAPSDGAGQEEASSPVWPEDWRDRFAGSDEKMLKHLNRFASPEGIYKAWRTLDRRRNDGSLLPARPETDDENTLAEWRKAVGAPESPDGYAVDIPEDVSEIDRAALGEVFKEMHHQGIPASQAKPLIDKYFDIMRAGSEARANQDIEFRRESEDALRNEWGPEYRPNINAIGLLIDSHGDKALFERMQGARYEDGTRFGDDPATLKFLASIAREVHPDGNLFVPTSAGVTREASIEDEIRTLEMEMRDTKGRDPGGYWNDSRKQQRYLELVEYKERMKARAR